jgi:hypothetical protein
MIGGSQQREPLHTKLDVELVQRASTKRVAP